MALTVSTWTMPPRTEGFRTLFLVQPQTYFARVDPANASGPRSSATALLRPPLALPDRARRLGLRLADAGRLRRGPSWHTDRATRMRAQAAPGFNTLRVPLSTQHQAGQAWLGKASPYAPSDVGAVARARAAVLGARLDRPRRRLGLGRAGAEGVAPRRAAGGGAAPRLPRREGALDGLAAPREPLAPRRRRRRPRRLVGARAALLRAVRQAAGAVRGRRGGAPARQGALVVTYHGVAGSPGFDATEPLTDVRMFFAWNALEGTAGTLYSDGLARYQGLDPWRALPGDGQSVFLYPGTPARPAPVPSLRLEAIRDGIQDADLFLAYARVYGRAGLVRLLAQNGLFRANAKRRARARVHERVRAADDDEVRVAGLAARRGRGVGRAAAGADAGALHARRDAVILASVGLHETHETGFTFRHRLPREAPVERHAALLEAARGKRVVHVGFVDELVEQKVEGHVWLHARLAEVASELVGLDFSERGVAWAQAQGYEAHLVDCQSEEDVRALGLAPADVVVAGEILEHLDAPGPFLRAMRLLAKPEGELLVTTPNAYRLLNFLAPLSAGNSCTPTTRCGRRRGRSGRCSSTPGGAWSGSATTRTRAARSSAARRRRGPRDTPRTRRAGPCGGTGSRRGGATG